MSEDGEHCGEGEDSDESEAEKVEVEVFMRPNDEKDIAEEDHPAGGNAEDVVGEDSNSGDSEIGESVMQSEVIYGEGLEGASKDDGSYGLPFGGDECEGE